MTMSLILVAIFCLLAVDGTEETVVKVVENHIDVSLPTKQTFTSRGAMERKTDIQNTKSNFSLGTTQFTARPRRLRTYDSYSGFEQKYIGPRNDSFPAKVC